MPDKDYDNVEEISHNEPYDNPILKTPRIYQNHELHAWVSPPFFKENSKDLPGEMGKQKIK